MAAKVRERPASAGLFLLKQKRHKQKHITEPEKAYAAD